MAKKGYCYSLNNLAYIYKDTGNIRKAFHYLKLAAKNENDDIKFNYSLWHLNGIYFKQNVNKAIKILTRCYENGHIKSLKQLMLIQSNKYGNGFYDKNKALSYLYDIYINKLDKTELFKDFFKQDIVTIIKIFIKTTSVE